MPVSNSSVLVDRSIERRSVAMDRPPLLGVHGAAAIDRLADQVEHAAQRGRSDRNGDRRAGVDALLAANHAVGAAQSDAANAAAAEVLLHFADQVDANPFVLRGDLDRVIDGRLVFVLERDVERRADHLGHVADVVRRRLMIGGSWHDFV